MKTTAVSGDLLFKVALAGGALLVLAYLANKAASVASDAAQAASDAAWQVSPLNNENVIYTTANTLTGGSKNTTLGSRIYDWFHSDPLKMN